MRTIGLVRFRAPYHYRNTTGGFTLLELTVVLVILAALAALVVPMVGDQQETNATVTNNASLTALRDSIIGNAGGPGLYADVRYAFPSGYDSDDLRVSHLFWNRLDGTNTNPVIQPYALETRKGWRGPYLRGGAPVLNVRPDAFNIFPASTDRRFDGDTTFAVRGFFPGGTTLYGSLGEPAIGDAWGNPVVLQIPSNDPNGVAFTTPEAAWKYARIVSAGPNGVLNTVINNVHLQALAGKQLDNSAPARDDDVVIYLNRADIHE